MLFSISPGAPMVKFKSNFKMVASWASIGKENSQSGIRGTVLISTHYYNPSMNPTLNAGCIFNRI